MARRAGISLGLGGGAEKESLSVYWSSTKITVLNHSLVSLIRKVILRAVGASVVSPSNL